VGWPARPPEPTDAHLSARQRAWLHIERLPAYAPDLNPVQQLWGTVKGGDLANLCPSEILTLRRPLHGGFARIRRHPDLAFSFLLTL
jgi:transposase